MYVVLTREFKPLNSKEDIAFYLFDEDEDYQHVIDALDKIQEEAASRNT